MKKKKDKRRTAPLSRRLAVGLVWGLMLLCMAGKTSLAAEEESIRLRQPDAYGNTPFRVENMLPGDSETKIFTVKVSHRDPITLYHCMETDPEEDSLAGALQIAVYLPKDSLMLYQGPVTEMPEFVSHTLAADEKELVYRITVSMDTSAGNEYQYKSLKADLRWWYEEEPEPETEASKPERPSPAPPSGTGGGATGDETDLTGYLAAGGGALAAIVLLLFLKGKKKEDREA